jgi:hypothetical protein
MDRSFFEILERSYKAEREIENTVKRKFLKNDPVHYLRSFAGFFRCYAYRAYFIENNLEKCKDYLWLSGKCQIVKSQILKIKGEGGWLFEVARTKLSEVALSDNIDLINEYACYDYEKKFINANKHVRLTSFSKDVINGELDVYPDAMLSLMIKDMERLDRDLKIIKDVTLKKKMNSWMELDYELFKSILQSNEKKATEILTTFVSNKMHKSRNIHENYREILSFPALGYAKLCWINGLEVKVNSPFLPIDLLNVQPLSIYSDFEQVYPSKYLNEEYLNKPFNESILIKIGKWLIGKE